MHLMTMAFSAHFLILRGTFLSFILNQWFEFRDPVLENKATDDVKALSHGQAQDLCTF
jgi:hypothetical protein